MSVAASGLSRVKRGRDEDYRGYGSLTVVANEDTEAENMIHPEY
jgi:hypothetical protein